MQNLSNKIQKSLQLDFRKTAFKNWEWNLIDINKYKSHITVNSPEFHQLDIVEEIITPKQGLELELLNERLYLKALSDDTIVKTFVTTMLEQDERIVNGILKKYKAKFINFYIDQL